MARGKSVQREREREDRDYRETRWHARNVSVAEWGGISGLEALRPIRTNARSRGWEGVHPLVLVRSITAATLSVDLIQNEFRVHRGGHRGFDYSIIDYPFERFSGLEGQARRDRAV